MDLIDTVRDVDFEFGIGDPTFLGWFTVVAYLVAAGLAVANAWRASAGPNRTLARLWWTLAVLLLLLAVNKQLDVQSYFTEVGRAVAREQGWYDTRSTVQFFFVVGVALASLAAIGLITWALRDVLRQQWLTLVGIVAIVGFVLIRASSFHYVDRLIGLELAGLRINWIIELGAIGVVCASAVIQLRRPPEAGADVMPGAHLDRGVRLVAFALLGAGCLVGAGALMLAGRV